MTGVQTCALPIYQGFTGEAAGGLAEASGMSTLSAGVEGFVHSDGFFPHSKTIVGAADSFDIPAEGRMLSWPGSTCDGAVTGLSDDLVLLLLPCGVGAGCCCVVVGGEGGA